MEEYKKIKNVEKVIEKEIAAYDCWTESQMSFVDSLLKAIEKEPYFRMCKEEYENLVEEKVKNNLKYVLYKFPLFLNSSENVEVFENASEIIKYLDSLPYSYIKYNIMYEEFRNEHICILRISESLDADYTDSVEAWLEKETLSKG